MQVKYPQKICSKLYLLPRRKGTGFPSCKLENQFHRRQRPDSQYSLSILQEISKIAEPLQAVEICIFYQNEIKNYMFVSCRCNAPSNKPVVSSQGSIQDRCRDCCVQTPFRLRNAEIACGRNLQPNADIARKGHSPVRENPGNMEMFSDRPHHSNRTKHGGIDNLRCSSRAMLKYSFSADHKPVKAKPFTHKSPALHIGIGDPCFL